LTDSIISSVNRALSSSEHHPLLVIGSFVVRFLAIHPYQDGNGRLTVREAVALTGANRNTVKDHLRRLVNSGRLARRGRGRGTWYERT